MKRMKTKDQFINVIGAWDGTGTGPVIDYLTEKGYTFKVQVGGNMKFGIDEYDAEMDGRTRLVVLGDGVYEQWAIDKDSILAVDDADNLHIHSAKELEFRFQDVA